MSAQAIQLFGILFMMIGPVALIPAFDGMMRGLDDATVRRVAVRAALYAGAGLLFAALSGATVLTRVGASPPALVIASGLVLLLSVLGATLGNRTAAPAAGGDTPPGAMALALSPVAIPTILRPYAIGVFIAFTAFLAGRVPVAEFVGVAAAIAVVDLVAMLVARPVMRRIPPAFFTLLGAVFGVLQVSLAVQMMLDGFALAGAAPGGVPVALR